MTNSSISIDAATNEGGLSNDAKVNTNPPSIDTLGSGISSGQLNGPSTPLTPGVGKASDPSWNASITNGDWRK